MRPRCCVYTALYGDLDQLPEQPVRSKSALDFIAFVGDPRLTSDTWTVRHLPPRLPGDSVRSARFAKLHPHLLLKEYDASLYIDCTVLLKRTPEALFDGLLFGQTETMACLRNSYRDNVADEALAIVDLGYGDPEACLRQLIAYAHARYRGDVPLMWTGLLLRFHHDARVVAAMETWWEHVLRYSRRDQLSFSYVAEMLDFPFLAHALDNEDSTWHRWPLSTSRERAPWTRPPVPTIASPSAFQTKLLSAIERLSEISAQAHQPIDDARVRLHVAQTACDRLERELAAMRESTCWKVTAPLRWLRDVTRARRAKAG